MGCKSGYVGILIEVRFLQIMRNEGTVLWNIHMERIKVFDDARPMKPRCHLSILLRSKEKIKRISMNAGKENTNFTSPYNFELSFSKMNNRSSHAMTKSEDHEFQRALSCSHIHAETAKINKSLHQVIICQTVQLGKVLE